MTGLYVFLSTCAVGLIALAIRQELAARREARVARRPGGASLPAGGCRDGGGRANGPSRSGRRRHPAPYSWGTDRDIYLTLAIRSAGAGIQTPAVGALLPQLVPTHALMRVNGINGTIQASDIKKGAISSSRLSTAVQAALENAGKVGPTGKDGATV